MTARRIDRSARHEQPQLRDIICEALAAAPAGATVYFDAAGAVVYQSAGRETRRNTAAAQTPAGDEYLIALIARAEPSPARVQRLLDYVTEQAS